MSQRLPTRGFKWEKNLTIEKVFNPFYFVFFIANRGYIFEVDLEYPEELWKTNNDYPLAPEKMKLDNVEKLVCTFLTKKSLRSAL